MKKLILILAAAALALSLNAQEIPHLAKVGSSTCLIVDGKPLVLRCGELNNSTASSIGYMEEQRTFDKLKALNLNSVIATASWELVEPEEGKFRFDEVDYVIEQARAHDMKVIFIWFGTFKNPFMTYAPTWFKQNHRKYPHAVSEDGRQLEMPSVWSDAVVKADAKAYLAFLRHIKEVDRDQTVVMIQIGNEPGLRESKRDFSAPAQKAWKADVPAQLIQYLQANAATLQPDLKKAWESNGCKTKGNWETVFGKSLTEDDGTNPILNHTEHLFTAWGFARYLEYLAVEGKKVYALPTFTNASVFGVNSRGRSLGNGCSISDFFDIYRAGAPALDILTPNSYMQQLDQICESYSWNGNPILIPESSVSSARGIYVVGEWDAIAFSPFGIDSWANGVLEAPSAQQKLFSEGYALLGDADPLIREHLGKETMRGTYLYNGHVADTLTVGDYVVTFSRGRSFNIGAMMAPATGANPNAGPRQEPRFEGAAILVQSAEDEFYLMGYGVNAAFRLKDGVKSAYCGYDRIDEGRFENGKFVPGRLLNGDERNAFLPDGKVTVLRVRLYHY